MELLFVWYGNVNENKLRNQGLTFGGPMDVKYDEKEDLLYIERNKKHLEDFFSVDSNQIPITNITAIVGRNGAGKTSALKAIAQSAFCTYNFKNVQKIGYGETYRPEQRYISVFSSNDNIFVFYSGMTRPEIVTNVPGHQVKMYDAHYDANNSTLPDPLGGGVLTSIAAYYFSTAKNRGDRTVGLHKMRWQQNCQIKDISPDIDEGKQLHRNLLALEQNEPVRTAIKKSKFPFPVDATIRLDDSFRSPYSRKIGGEIVDANSAPSIRFKKHVEDHFQNNPDPNWLGNGLNRFKLQTMINFCYQLADHGIGDRFIQSGRLNGTYFHLDIDDRIETYLLELENTVSGTELADEVRYPSIKGLRKLFDYYDQLEKSGICDRQPNAPQHNRAQLVMPFEGKCSALEFVRYYHDAFPEGNFLDVWLRQLSQGEYSLLDLFAGLVTAQQSPPNNQKLQDIEHVALLIDEPDVFLHPQWEKQFLKFLIDLLPSVFPGKSIQIVLTTNKPILLSDLPKNNVLFLRKDADGTITNVEREEETFAQNIHKLYADSFFIEEGLIGDFARAKLKELSRRIANATPKDFEPLNVEIELIGETVIRNKLRQMLVSQTQTGEIDLLRNRVRELEERLDDQD